jgi:hypothetical protein
MTIENKTDLEITISVLNYELSSDKEKSNRLDKGIDSVINESINLFNNECEINKYVGKNKKAFRIATTEKNGLTKLYQIIHKLGKNCLKVVKLIGENPITTKTNYTEKMENGGRITTIEGLKTCAKPTEKTDKTIEEKIENFIKTNTTKKEDDGKMTIKEFSAMFGKIASQLHSSNNSNIVDMLPSKEDIAKIA